MKKTLVMGIVNVTPDSFSDGGKYPSVDEAVRRGKNMIREGADIIDIGGESTRPGAEPIAWQEEWARVEDVIAALAPLMNAKVRMSIDTYHPETAARALAAGVKVVNCVSGATLPAMLQLVSGDESLELVAPLSCRSMIDPALMKRVYLDPMIGFGTSREEDLALLRAIPELASGSRLLVGASRKRIVKKLTGEKLTGKNLGGNLAIALWCAINGVCAVRVHDVKETVQALKVVAALAGGSVKDESGGIY